MQNLRLVDLSSLQQCKITYSGTCTVCLIVIASSSRNFMSIGEISIFMKTGWSDIKVVDGGQFHNS